MQCAVQLQSYNILYSGVPAPGTNTTVSLNVVLYGSVGGVLGFLLVIVIAIVILVISIGCCIQYARKKDRNASKCKFIVMSQCCWSTHWEELHKSATSTQSRLSIVLYMIVTAESAAVAMKKDPPHVYVQTAPNVYQIKT